MTITYDREYDTLSAAPKVSANTGPESDCYEQSPLAGPGQTYICTRAFEHEGPHVAHRADGAVILAWTD